MSNDRHDIGRGLLKQSIAYFSQKEQSTQRKVFQTETMNVWIVFPCYKGGLVPDFLKLDSHEKKKFQLTELMYA